MAFFSAKKLRENPETSKAGMRWTQDEDVELMTIALNTPDYTKIATQLQRTAGAVKNRIFLNVYNMINDENTVDVLCEKYHVDKEEFEYFKNKKETVPVKEKEKPIINNDKDVLVEIRDLLKIIVEKMNK